MNDRIFSGDYFKLFVKRESKVVLGNGCSNLWLLAIVLTLTFLAIAFSNASMEYLSFKMNDPFINWLNIENTSDRSDYSGMAVALDDEAVKEEYHILGYQEDYKFSYNFFTAKKQMRYFVGRFFQQLNTPLVDAILSEDNVVRGQKVSSIEEIDECSVGMIITEEMLSLLGYRNAPAYIDLARYSPGADEYGFELYTDDSYAALPIPVLGVVKQLPGNMDFISSSYFLEQDFNDSTHPFLMANETYASSLHFFVPEEVGVAKFEEEVLSMAEEAGIELESDASSFYRPEIIPFMAGDFISFFPQDGFSYSDLQEFAAGISRRYDGDNVRRVFDFDFSESYISQISFMSVHFSDLDCIKGFEKFALDEYDIKINMEQINAKDNFNSVSLMANILSWAIIAFSIICIILFVVNLLQSYFQKVKRNMGTFKAFGISNKELISIYLLIMAGIIVSAIAISLAAVYLVELILPLFGVLKDGYFSYFMLWNSKTIWAVLIILFSSIMTVYFVMNRLLAYTPGDLIYDRQ